MEGLANCLNVWFVEAAAYSLRVRRGDRGGGRFTLCQGDQSCCEGKHAMGWPFRLVFQDSATPVKPPSRERRTISDIVVPNNQERVYCRSRPIAAMKAHHMCSLTSCDRHLLLANHKCRVAE